jgi:hypothetical protein
MHEMEFMQNCKNDGLSQGGRAMKEETHMLRCQAIAWQMIVYGVLGTAQTRSP